MMFSSLFVCILIFAGILLAWSSGKIEPFLDANGDVLAGSVSEKKHVMINGVQQGMIIRSKDISNPVLLFLHGGPGMPEYFLEEKYPAGLEEHFTVCWWEQSGAGLSYHSELQAETITAEQLVADTLEVTNYLREQFGQDKIYLMGHSWGTFLGIQAAAQSPELYHAYIGISQISRQAESERLAYTHMLAQYQAVGNTKMARKLEAYPIHSDDAAFASYVSSFLRDEAMHELGIGTTRAMRSTALGIFLPVMQCRAYTLDEKINLWRGKAFLAHSTTLRERMYATDLTDQVPELEIPVYFFSGLYDYTVSYTLAREYFEQLQAPIKGFYTLSNPRIVRCSKNGTNFCVLCWRMYCTPPSALRIPNNGRRRFVQGRIYENNFRKWRSICFIKQVKKHKKSWQNP